MANNNLSQEITTAINECFKQIDSLIQNQNTVLKNNKTSQALTEFYAISLANKDKIYQSIVKENLTLKIQNQNLSNQVQLLQNGGIKDKYQHISSLATVLQNQLQKNEKNIPSKESLTDSKDQDNHKVGKVTSNIFHKVGSSQSPKKGQQNIIEAVQIMNQSLLLQDTFTTIIEQTCKILECDRSSVFLIDFKKNQLWTKVAKGSTEIRLPIDSGIVGFVAINGQVLNILDAHEDYRFNREIDKKNNYRTKTVLAIPIYDNDKDKVIGVLQAINKKDGFFTRDDEGLGFILTNLAKVILKNSLYHDEKVAFHNSLRQLLRVGISFNGVKSLDKLLLIAENKLVNNFETSEVHVFCYDTKEDTLFRFDKNKEQQIFPSNLGITGDVFHSGCQKIIYNNYENVLYHQNIDLATSMPVIYIPLYAYINKQKRKVGIIAAIDNKAIENLLTNQNQPQKTGGNTMKAFYETLDNFALILAQAILNLVSPDESKNSEFQNDDD